jgi:hypothetical protein
VTTPAPEQLPRAQEQLARWVDGRERLDLLAQALRHREASPDADPGVVASTRGALARALYETGDVVGAQAQLSANVEASALPTDDDRSRFALRQRVAHANHRLELAWLLLAQGRLDEARLHRDVVRRLMPERVTVSWGWVDRRLREFTLWMALAGDDPAALRSAWSDVERDSRDMHARGRGARDLDFALDEIVVARRLRDDAMAQRAAATWRAAAADSPGQASWVCRPGEDDLEGAWLAMQHRARRSAAKEAGWCASVHKTER